MPLYFFRISNGRYAGASDQGSEFESREAAWAEMTKVCSNLLGSISRSMKQNAEWQMEMLDESKKPVFRIRLVAESIGDPRSDSLGTVKAPDFDRRSSARRAT